MDTNNRVSIRIFDKDIKFLGEVDLYTSLFYISKWETFGAFEFHVKVLDTSLYTKGNIIMIGNDGTRAGVIEHVEVSQDEEESIKINGFSLGYWLSQRITVPPVGYAYHSFNTHVEDVMASLVKANAVDPVDPNRQIPNLIIGKDVNSSRNLLLSSGEPTDLSDQPVIPTESNDVFEVQGDEWGRNYFRPSLVNNLAWVAAGGIGYGVLRSNPNWKGFYIPVKPGEIYSLSRTEIINNRFGVYFTEEEPADKIPALQKAYRNDTALKIEGIEVPEGANYLFVYLSNQADELPKIKLEKGSQATPWTPAPEDLTDLKGTHYSLSTTLNKDQYYTLSVEGDFSNDDFIGVWLGTDKFIGYLQDDKITFKANEDYGDTSIILKSLSETGIINRVNLNRGSKVQPWTPAPEDGPKMFYQSRYKNLADELTKLSKSSGLGWGVELDYRNKQFIFKVFEGRDLSSNQTINPPQLFSIDFDNVKKQSYIDSNIGYRNCGYVAGQGEGENREIVLLNNELSGFERRETFIDARDVDESDKLVDRGKVKLSETPEIKAFECEVESRDYKKHWNLGDIVSTVNKKWQLVMHNRVTEVMEVWEEDGYKIIPTFGTPLPMPGDKIKQITDTPLTELIEGPQGEEGPQGPPGYSVQYTWNGTNLGIKREDEASYTYVDLKGPKGDIGPKGEQGIQGPDGKSLEFAWDGTRFGVRLEGDSTYQYVDLKGDRGPQGERGPQGIQGPKGDKGDQGERGVQGPKGEIGPIGPKGDKPAHQWNGSQVRFENPNGTWGLYTDLIGPQGSKGEKGDKGDPGPQGPQGVQGPAGDGQSYVVFQELFIAIQGQTVFEWNSGYVYPTGINAIAVYLNGIRLPNSAFVETSGNSITMKQPMNAGDIIFIEAMQAVVDLQGPPGQDGKNLEFNWDGTKLGIRQQGETAYQYVDLKGDKGAKGDTGSKGDQGIGLQFVWNGTQLGVKRETDTAYAYVDLRGPQGLKGDTGAIGPKGDRGATGATGPKGDKGDIWRPSIDSGGNLSWTLNNGTTQPTIVNVKGPKGDQGSQGPKGDTGAQGPKGDPGPQGERGLQGPKGDRGDIGPQGPPGKDGEDGTQIYTQSIQPTSIKAGEVWIQTL